MIDIRIGALKAARGHIAKCLTRHLYGSDTARPFRHFCRQLGPCPTLRDPPALLRPEVRPHAEVAFEVFDLFVAGLEVECLRVRGDMWSPGPLYSFNDDAKKIAGAARFRL